MFGMDGSAMIATGVVIGLALFGLFALTTCFFRVEEGHVAVLTIFGAVQRREGKPVTPGGGKASAPLMTYGPGMHRKAPWAHVHEVSLMEQNLKLSDSEGSTAMAADGTVLRFDSVLRTQPSPEELEQYLLGLRSPREHMMGLFSCLLRNEIANFGVERGETGAALARRGESERSSYALILKNRTTLNARIEAFCRDEIASRYGVRFHGVDLTDILPPDELAEALNAVINSEKEADAQLSRAEAEAEQRVLASERGVEIARARASAAEIEIVQLATYLVELREQRVLSAYVARRRSEVLGEARTTYLKEAIS